MLRIGVFCRISQGKLCHGIETKVRKYSRVKHIQMRLIPKGELVISFMSGMMDGVIRHPAFCDTFTVQIENIGMPYICRFYDQGCGILSVSRKRIEQLNGKEGRDRLCLKLRDR